MRIMGASPVDPPVDGPATPPPGRAIFWATGHDRLGPTGAQHQPGLAVLHHDQDGGLRLHHLDRVPGAVLDRDARFSLVLDSHAGAAGAQRGVEDGGWHLVGVEHVDGPPPVPYRVELFTHTAP